MSANTEDNFFAAAKNNTVFIAMDILNNCPTYLNTKNQDGDSALMLAAREGHQKMTEMLMGRKGIKPDLANRKGNSALIMAAQHGHDRVVDTLLLHYLNINMPGADGWTALMCAAGNGYIKVVDMLFKRGSGILNLNMQTTKDGWTALHLAAKNGHYAIVEILVNLDSGILDYNIKDKGGKTALDVAKDNQCKMLLEDASLVSKAKQRESQKRILLKKLTLADREKRFKDVASLLDQRPAPSLLLHELPNYYSNINEALADQVPTIGDTQVANAQLTTRDLTVQAARAALTPVCIFCKRLTTVASHSMHNIVSICDQLKTWLKGCDVDCTGVYHILAASGSTDALALLEAIDSVVSAGSRATWMGKLPAFGHRTALETAVDSGHVVFAKQLVQTGAQYNAHGLLRGKDPTLWAPFVKQCYETQSAVGDIKVALKRLKRSDNPLPTLDAVSRDEVEKLIGESPSWQSIRALSQAAEHPQTSSLSDFAATCARFACALVRFGDPYLIESELPKAIDKYFARIKTDPMLPLHPGILFALGHHYAQTGDKHGRQFLTAFKNMCNVSMTVADEDIIATGGASDQEFVALETALFGNSIKHASCANTGAGAGGTPDQVKFIQSLSKEERAPLDALNKLIGLSSIKDIALKLYKSVKNDQFLRNQKKENSIVSRTYNFVFVGNPGVGKTVVAKIFADILEVTGKRSGVFKKFLGSGALKMGAVKFAAELQELTGAGQNKTGPSNADLPQDRFLENEKVMVDMNGKKWPATVIKLPSTVKLDTDKEDVYEVMFDDGNKKMQVPFAQLSRADSKKPQGGVIFIDECYDLKPSTNSEGKLILSEIMNVAEEYRDTVSVILAGYKDDIDNEIFAQNIGMASRFETVAFPDFEENELEKIWRMYCADKDYVCNDATCIIVRRRLVRQRKRGKGFGNARTVRELFIRAANVATDRFCSANKKGSIEISEVDVLGPEPADNKELERALQELDQMVGIPLVKKSIHDLVEIVTKNYFRELDGAEPDEVWLNKLFVGNPGTGKTTVAKLYGRILSCLGLLSKSEVEYKAASDFIGSVVGESQTKTANILKLCEGKTLIIDEAYNLHTGSSGYGAQVLDTLCEKVSGSPGADGAVILVGYEDQLITMLRESNPGLNRRFNSANPMRFTDFTNEELCRIATAQLRRSGFCNVNFTIVSQIVDHVASLRLLPNFGNAGAVDTFITSMIIRMRSRQCAPGQENEILEEDLSDDDPSTRAYRTNPMLVLNELESIGNLKEDMQELGDGVRILRELGRDTSLMLRNYMFLGNPGTGKTEIARKMGQLFHTFGLLPTSNCVITSSLDLTGQYLGESKTKVEAIMKSARGGILFIDEAYNLGKGQFGREVQDKLLQMLTEADYEGKMVVILAGYTTEMQAMCDKNPGFKSRFAKIVVFPDWTEKQCSSLIINRAAKLSPPVCWEDPMAAEALLSQGIARVRRNDKGGWANARDAVSLFGHVQDAQLRRLGQTNAGGGAINEAMASVDVSDGVERFLRARPPVKASSEICGLVVRLADSDGPQLGFEDEDAACSLIEDFLQTIVIGALGSSLNYKTAENVFEHIKRFHSVTDARIATPAVTTALDALRQVMQLSTSSRSLGSANSAPAINDDDDDNVAVRDAADEAPPPPPMATAAAHATAIQCSCEPEAREFQEAAAVAPDTTIGGLENTLQEAKAAKNGPSSDAAHTEELDTEIARIQEVVARCKKLEKEAEELREKLKLEEEKEKRQKELARQLKIEAEQAAKAARDKAAKAAAAKALEELLAKQAADQKARELVRKQLEEEERLRRAEAERILEEERKAARLAEKLRRIGRCDNGFRWINHGTYYQCAGGAHTVRADDPRLNDNCY